LLAMALWRLASPSSALSITCDVKEVIRSIPHRFHSLSSFNLKACRESFPHPQGRTCSRQPQPHGGEQAAPRAAIPLKNRNSAAERSFSLSKALAKKTYVWFSCWHKRQEQVFAFGRHN
jgi:hypothetical protein